MKVADGMTFEDLVEIVQLIESSANFRELHLKVGGLEIDVTRRENGEDAQPTVNGQPPIVADREG